MIDIVTDKEWNLKNLKQIGTPQEENKIYVENLVYSKIKEENHKEKTVYILMGHTERMNGNYATFAEAAISVNDMDFSAGIPRWSNQIWAGVFREIKRLYENMIIVGWVCNMKGLMPKMTPELERIHREYFGGNHQIMLLMDSLEKEETFYTYKENRLVPKTGFYIYYHTKAPKQSVEEKKYEMVSRNLEAAYEREMNKEEPKMVEGRGTAGMKGGRYRELLQEQRSLEVKEGSNLGIAVAVALLIFVLGVGAYENRDSLFGNGNIPAIEETGFTPGEDTQTNASEVSASEAEASEVIGENTGNTIPVEIIPGEEEKNSE